MAGASATAVASADVGNREPGLLVSSRRMPRLCRVRHPESVRRGGPRDERAMSTLIGCAELRCITTQKRAALAFSHASSARAPVIGAPLLPLRA